VCENIRKFSHNSQNVFIPLEMNVVSLMPIGNAFGYGKFCTFNL
jgi:hypothetical protein